MEGRVPSASRVANQVRASEEVVGTIVLRLLTPQVTAKASASTAVSPLDRASLSAGGRVEAHRAALRRSLRNPSRSRTRRTALQDRRRRTRRPTRTMRTCRLCTRCPEERAGRSVVEAARVKMKALHVRSSRQVAERSRTRRGSPECRSRRPSSRPRSPRAARRPWRRAARPSRPGRCLVPPHPRKTCDV